ncbi:MAG: hypothetical protein Q8M76_01805 [Spirochaetaceae bacterium]|nr:hypothetical protein [Spirochaetaceae bacterium]
METDDEPRIPFIRADIDAESLADWFDAGFPLEFCASDSFDPGLVDSLCFAGFIPMATRDQETGTEYLLPKLHLGRAIVEPGAVAATKTARRESGRYLLGADGRFDEVLELCARTHGEEWLRPPLRATFRELFATRSERSSRFASFELYAAGGPSAPAQAPQLVAGEIGVFAGACYTSLTGFRTLPGSGTVQLAAVAGYLLAAGARIWDLGMPLDYKFSLGATCVSRGEFLGLFRAARSASLRMPPADGLVPARELIDRLQAGAG